MHPLTALGIVAAGTAAGTVNTVVGSGSLITFPTLMAAGYSPVVANMSNNVGLVPGSASGAYGYRAELKGQAHRVRTVGLASTLGGITGAVLLLAAPGSFKRVVPFLVLLACLLVAVQPRLRAWLDRRGGDGRGLYFTVYATGVYGGYFGAAQGVILMALLSIFIVDDLHRLNALKNVLAGIVNGVAAVLFITFGTVAYAPAALIAVGSIAGGQIGARYGRRLPPQMLRALVIGVGVIVALKLLVAP